MSKRAHVLRQLKTLDELSGIMAAMKNLSLMETVKLARLVPCQRRVLESIAAVASDFLVHHPQTFIARARVASRIVVAIGSQRGFCGEFNESIVRALDALPNTAGDHPLRVLVVGRRLAAKLAKRSEVVTTVDGPSVIEEVHDVLARVMNALVEIHASLGSALFAQLTVLAHRDGEAGVRARALWPPASDGDRASAYAPRLNLDPAVFGQQLVHHFLWAQLHDLFYGSLMAENRRRLQHMQGATQRMDERREALRRTLNVLRQEEITEEIEVILLSDER